MTASENYTPPSVWTWDKQNGGKFASTNRPVAGPMHEKNLPVGHHPLQLYSLGTPNGVKVTIMLEELLALGHEGAEYDAWLINIGDGDQFGSGFTAINPNSKIPALVDQSGGTPPARLRIRIDPALSRREIRGFSASGCSIAHGLSELAFLAGRQRTLSRRRLWPFLCLRP